LGSEGKKPQFSARKRKKGGHGRRHGESEKKRQWLPYYLGDSRKRGWDLEIGGETQKGGERHLGRGGGKWTMGDNNHEGGHRGATQPPLGKH